MSGHVQLLIVATHLLEVLFLSFLELFLEEQHDIFNVTAGGHTQDNADSFPADLHISAAHR